ncbi:MAG TPA: ferritin family protein, partial [Methanomicrobiales archaeon]|nr:ferritin family protein [Methanomicrobiales archaeon]
FEWSTLYPGFAQVAKEEGFMDVAKTFRVVAKVEVSHDKRYRKLLDNVQKGKVFSRKTPVYWKCRNCGLVLKASEAPERCPTCDHPRAYYEIFVEPY